MSATVNVFTWSSVTWQGSGEGTGVSDRHRVEVVTADGERMWRCDHAHRTVRSAAKCIRIAEAIADEVTA